MTEKTAIYVTKNALTSGIKIIEINPSEDITSEGNVWHKTSKTWDFIHRSEWYPIQETAIANVELRRERKLISLRKQIAKLEALTFEVKP